MRAILIMLMVGIVFCVNGCKPKEAEKDLPSQTYPEAVKKDILQSSRESKLKNINARVDAIDFVRSRIKSEEVELKSYYDPNKTRMISRVVIGTSSSSPIEGKELNSASADTGNRPDYSMAEYAVLLPDITGPNSVTITTSGGNVQLQYQFCMQTYKQQDSNDRNSREWTFLGPVEPVVIPYGEVEMWENIERRGCYRLQIKVPLDKKDVKEKIEIQQDSNTTLIYQVYKKTDEQACLISNPIFIDEYDNWTGSWVFQGQVYSIFTCPNESFQIEFETTEWNTFFNLLNSGNN